MKGENMLQVVLRGVHDIGLEERPKPVLIKDTDLILKVTASALCTSDVHYAEGSMPIEDPISLGHEFVGIVDQVGSQVKKFKVGDRVAPAHYAWCGACEMCRTGRDAWCPNGALYGSGKGWGDLAGGLSEYVRVLNADGSCLPIPDSVSDEQALFASDVLASGYYALELADLKTPNKTVAVFGAGPIGLSAVQAAALWSPKKIILMDMMETRLELGLKMGATDIINASKVEDVVEEIKKLTGGEGVDVAIDFVGFPKVMNQAFHAIKKFGTVVIMGTGTSVAEVPMQQALLNCTTMKTGCTAQHNNALIMDLLTRGVLTVDPFITHIMPLSDFDKGFKIFANHEDGVMKVIFKP
jgi:threonine dehydrogenase-like Zn-dependent dehydrogenase